MMEVCAYLQGGLGNQCFIYAAARALSLRTGAALSFDTDLFVEDVRYRRMLALEGFSCELDCLPTGVRWHRVMKSLRSRLMGRLCSGWRNYRCDGRPFKYRPFPRNWRGMLTLDGYWQSERYFYDQREQILKDFALKEDSWLEQDGLAQVIAQTDNSIFLHIRSYKEVPGKACGQSAVAMRGYYRNALQYLSARVRGGTVFVFSDDIDLARRQVLTEDILKDLRLEFVFNTEESTQLRDFTLMRLCRHGISADSSFSWWAGWLGEQEWLRKGEAPLRLRIAKRVMNDDFWPKRWITIDA